MYLDPLATFLNISDRGSLQAHTLGKIILRKIELFTPNPDQLAY